MKKTLLYLSFVVLLFCGNAVLYSAFGWTMDFYDAPIYQKIRPEFYILVLYMGITSFGWSKIALEEKSLILLTCMTLLYFIVTGQTDGFSVLINAIILPVLISSILLRLNEKDKNRIFGLILMFFFVNSFVAIFERVVGYNLLPYYSGGELSDVSYDFDISTFRSSALRNHPLGNALLTTCIMGFILVSYRIKGRMKLLLFFIGFISVMCFNTRSSIMIAGGILFFYLLYNIFITNEIGISRVTLFVLTGICIGAIYYLFSMGFGGRLLEKDNLNDTSVEARLLLFEKFLSLDISNYFFGMSNDKILALVNLSHIENFWILFLFRFGIIIFIAYIVCFYRLFRRWLRGYHWTEVVVPTAMFLLVASVNNSIYSGEPGIALFFMCTATMLSRDIK